MTELLQRAKATPLIYKMATKSLLIVSEDLSVHSEVETMSVSDSRIHSR